MADLPKTGMSWWTRVGPPSPPSINLDRETEAMLGALVARIPGAGPDAGSRLHAWLLSTQQAMEDEGIASGQSRRIIRKVLKDVEGRLS